MSEQIDIESALEDAIFQVEQLEDIYDLNIIRSRAAQVLEECLRPARAAAKANEKRVKALLDSLEAALTASTIDRIATPEAKQDPGVMPVLRKLDCKVAQLTAPELLASIHEESADAE